MTWDDIEFAAAVSARYHRRRAAFLERVSSTISVLTLVSGAGAFVAVVGDATMAAKIAAVGTVVLGIIQIVFQTDKCANEHRHWLRAWNQMLREVHENENADATMIKAWIKRKLEIESECIAEMRALANDSWNRTMNELGREAEPYKLNWWQRLWMQFFSFENAAYR
jgi:hypothetical protein